MQWRRLTYLVAKIRRALSDGTFPEKAGRFLFASVWVPFEVTVGHCRLSSQDRRLDVAAGFADHRAKQGGGASNAEHIRRIIAAYKASKQAQRTAPAAFEIHGLWAEWIDINFKSLVRALESEDTSTLASLLENLHREQFTLGLGSSMDEYIRCRSSLTGRFYVRTVWCRYRDKFRSMAPPEARIHSPLVGNPAGICLDGDVIPIQAFRHACHAYEMAGWLRDSRQAVVAEIGGGIGAQAYQAMRVAHASIAKYLVFDIPEVAAICAYFLLSALPGKRIRLFGEGPVSAGPSDEYDVAVFPHFTVTQLADESVDLFHNSCSFSEMDRASASAYLEVVERACRKYFSHVNHDVRLVYHCPDGSTHTNRIGSEMAPDPRRFEKVFRKPRLFSLPTDRLYPAFEYLYERRAGSSQPR